LTTHLRSIIAILAILLSAACVLASVDHRGAHATTPVRDRVLPF
jgi:hypothetical protein